MICKKCNIDKHLEDFPMNRVNGKDYKRKSCKVCFYAERKTYDSRRGKKLLIISKIINKV